MTKRKLNPQTLGYSLLFVLVTMIWGGGFLVTNDLVKGVPVFMLLFLRFAIGTMVLFVAKKLRKEPKITKQELMHGIFVGVVLFASFIFQTYGAKYTTPSKNGMLTGLYVIMVPVMVSVYHKKLNMKIIIDALVCLLGMGILFGIFNSSFSGNIGDVLTVFCALTFAIHFFVLEKYASMYSPINFTMLQLLVACLLSGVCSLVIESGDYSSITFTSTYAMQILFLGVLSSGFAYLMQTLVQSKISATTVSIIACLESVFAVVFSVMFGYESLTANFIIGAVLITVSMISSVVYSGDKKTEHAETPLN